MLRVVSISYDEFPLRYLTLFYTTYRHFGHMSDNFSATNWVIDTDWINMYQRPRCDVLTVVIIHLQQQTHNTEQVSQSTLTWGCITTVHGLISCINQVSPMYTLICFLWPTSLSPNGIVIGLDVFAWLWAEASPVSPTYTQTHTQKDTESQTHKACHAICSNRQRTCYTSDAA